LALPIVALLVVLDPATLVGNRDAGGWSLLIYPIFFLYGFILVAFAGLEGCVQRRRWLSLAIALLCSLGLTLLWVQGGEPRPAGPGFVLFEALYGFGAWCWLCSIWGFATLRLNFTTPVLRYANDAVLPFFVLHQSMMVTAAYAVVRQAAGDGLKVTATALLSFASTLAIYHFLIRPFNPMRLLFGLRPRRPQTEYPSARQPSCIDRF
jgi:hypothetical protein